MAQAVQDSALAFLAACRRVSGAAPKHKDRLGPSASEANNGSAASSDGFDEGDAKRKHHRPRGTGSLFRQKGRAVWMMKYCVNGKAIYQSTGKTDQVAAERVLQRKLREIAAGEFIEPNMEKITVDELAADYLRDYRINNRKSIRDAESGWEHHLKPHFGHIRATNVTTDLIQAYIDQRQEEGASNATINRELAALKRMLRLGYQANPPKVRRVPYFPHLKENNTRKGFLADEDYSRLAKECAAEGLWLRAMLEVAYTYGWRASELLNMRLSQIDLSSRSIYLNPGETKNDDARMVVMTPAVYELIKALVVGKKPDDHVFTRDDGKPVPRFFHSVWRTVCIRAGVGHWVCRNCGQKLKVRWCGQCSEKKLVADRVSYQGLLFHDLRRSGARNLRRAGIAEDVIMKIGGWRTRSVFSRYNIVSHNDIRDAVQKLERARREWGTVSATVSVAQEEGQSSGEAKFPLPN